MKDTKRKLLLNKIISETHINHSILIMLCDSLGFSDKDISEITGIEIEDIVYQRQNISSILETQKTIEIYNKEG